MRPLQFLREQSKSIDRVQSFQQVSGNKLVDDTVVKSCFDYLIVCSEFFLNLE